MVGNCLFTRLQHKKCDKGNKLGKRDKKIENAEQNCLYISVCQKSCDTNSAEKREGKDKHSLYSCGKDELFNRLSVFSKSAPSEIERKHREKHHASGKGFCPKSRGGNNKRRDDKSDYKAKGGKGAFEPARVARGKI